jgi:hypothetical protein
MARARRDHPLRAIRTIVNEALWGNSNSPGSMLRPATVDPAGDGHAERAAALHMIEPRPDRPTAITLGADKAYDADDFVNELRSMNVTPHVA